MVAKNSPSSSSDDDLDFSGSLVEQIKKWQEKVAYVEKKIKERENEIDEQEKELQGKERILEEEKKANALESQRLKTWEEDLKNQSVNSELAKQALSEDRKVLDKAIKAFQEEEAKLNRKEVEIQQREEELTRERTEFQALVAALKIVSPNPDMFEQNRDGLATYIGVWTLTEAWLEMASIPDPKAFVFAAVGVLYAHYVAIFGPDPEQVYQALIESAGRLLLANRALVLPPHQFNPKLEKDSATHYPIAWGAVQTLKGMVNNTKSCSRMSELEKYVKAAIVKVKKSQGE